MKLIIPLITILLLIPLAISFELNSDDVLVETGKINKYDQFEFLCEHDLCVITIDYFFQKGGCSKAGVRVLNETNETSKISKSCQIVHNCDPDDSCSATMPKDSLLLNYGEKASVECCYTRLAGKECEWNTENCAWGSIGYGYGGVSYDISYNNYVLAERPTTTTTTSTTSTSTTTTLQSCRSFYIRTQCISCCPSTSSTSTTSTLSSTTTSTITSTCSPSGYYCSSDSDCCSGKCKGESICNNPIFHRFCLFSRIFRKCE